MSPTNEGYMSTIRWMEWVKKRNISLAAWIAVIFGAVIPVVALIKSGANSLKFPDAPLFIQQGYAISQGLEFMRQNPNDLQYPFGLPSIISIGYKLSEQNAIAISRITLVILHFLTVITIFLILNSLRINRKIQFVAVLGFSLDPFVLKQTLDLQSEPITTLLVSLMCLMFITRLETPTKQKSIPFLYFFVVFLAIVTRPNLLIPILGLSMLIIYKWKQDKVTNLIIITATSTFLFYLISFQAFLFSIFGRFVPISGNSGQNFALACRSEFLPQYLGYADYGTNQSINAWYFQYLNEIREGFLTLNPLASIFDINEQYQNIGMQNCIENPTRTAWLFLVKSISLWRPSTVFGAYGISVFLFSILLWVPLTLMVIKFLSGKETVSTSVYSFRIFLIVFWGLFTISLIPSATQIRHRIAVAEQFYWIILAIYLNKRIVR